MAEKAAIVKKAESKVKAASLLAPMAGEVSEVATKAGKSLDVDQVVLKVKGNPELQAAFAIEEADATNTTNATNATKAFKPDAEIVLSSPDKKDVSQKCVIKSVDAKEIKVQCPADSALTKGEAVQIQLP